MTHRHYYFTGLLMILSSVIQAQVIPDSVRVNWSYAGIQESYLDTSNVMNVMNFGAAGNGTVNDYGAVTSAINALAGSSGIVFFPAGNYLINSAINLPDSVTLKGAGSDVTTLTFDLGGITSNCINIQHGPSNNYITCLSGFTRGSDTIILSNSAGFAPGDYGELRQANGSWDTNPAFWADNSVGQIVRIDSVSGNTLFIQHPLRFDYDSLLNVSIQKITPRTNANLECFKMTRADSTATGINYGVYYYFAANCHMRGVEMDHSIGAHVWAEASTALEITGCYFHHAYVYDGSNTKGYGVVMAMHTGESKIENNIFRHLRHAMMVKQGANGNVYAYNYSIEPTRSEFPNDFGGDISLHGHYAFANLFEGNICQNIMIDQSWGPSGPWNTFFRNRVDLYGIIMSSGTVNTDWQNFAGNDVTNTAPLHGNYVLTGNANFTYGNNILGVIQPSGTSVLPDSSCYLSAAPGFWNIPFPWPNTGTPYPLTNQSNPARERYLSGSGFTVCEPPPPVGVGVQGHDLLSPAAYIITPVFSDEITVGINENNHERITILIYDISGKILHKQEDQVPAGQTNIRLNTGGLEAGYYLVTIIGNNLNRTFRCVKPE